MAVLLSTFPAPARSGSAPIDARVVWTSHERAYIAIADSATLLTGDLVTFLERNRPIAWGTITSVVGNEMSVARLTAGSLAGVRRLDRVRIVSERPALRPPPVLRVGIPAASRGNLLFACDSVAFRPPPPPGLYRTDALSAHSFRLVRDTSATSPWPDTLMVRLFDESADQEIALERGDVDVAVFWPGELSSYIRAAPRWQDASSVVLARGALSAAWFAPAAVDSAPGNAPAQDPRVARLESELFRNDLVSWTTLDSGSAARGEVLPDPARFEVDASIPGRERMERVLNRGRAEGRDRVPVVRLFHLDARIDSTAALERGVADYVATHRLASQLGARTRDVLHVAHLFAPRCRVLCAPEFRPYLNALGTGAIVGLPCVGTRP